MTTDRDDMTDPALAQLLREVADESPPAHVDATILAAARRAVEPGQRVRSAASPWRWLLPLGAAATIAAIVISLQPLSPTPVEPMSSADNAPARQADQASPADGTAPASASALAPVPVKPQQRRLQRLPLRLPEPLLHRRPPPRRLENRPLRVSMPDTTRRPGSSASGRCCVNRAATKPRRNWLGSARHSPTPTRGCPTICVRLRRNRTRNPLRRRVDRWVRAGKYWRNQRARILTAPIPSLR